ncbi:MAG: hypothetical protein H0T44_06765 [Gemmatimonadales bacterium]|nr:hypothetical protein [Gemmatimonadales bacterium]
MGAEALRTPVKAAGDEEAGENDAGGEPREAYDAVKAGKERAKQQIGERADPNSLFYR